MKYGNFIRTPLAELIGARHFDRINPDITNERFPIPNRMWNNYKEIFFEEDIPSKEAVERIQAEGYEPANSHELLLWKGWNGKDAVVALGSVAKVGNNRFVLLLHGSGIRRHLFVRRLVGDLSAGYSFLAVCQQSLVLNP